MIFVGYNYDCMSVVFILLKLHKKFQFGEGMLPYDILLFITACVISALNGKILSAYELQN